jgi:hypothetical protein
MSRRLALSLLWAVIGCTCVPQFAHAQGMRGEIRATAGLVEYRGVRRDSLPEVLVPGSGIVRTLPDGTVVTCIPGGNCYWYRGGDVNQAHPLTQDIELVAWPGARGVSSRLHLRGRYGSDDLWPRSRQEVAVLGAWVDFERSAFRVRAGRQERRGGLGTEVFDGAAFLWRHWSRLRFEAFAGRSLVDALLQPRTGFLLHDADILAPNEDSMLWGLTTYFSLGPRFASSVAYRRNLRFDRAELYTERLAFDAWWRVRRAVIDASADYDLATGDFDEARVRLQGPVGLGVHLAGEVRHREPFFELWTIWGAFAPVGFDEAQLESWWEPRRGVRLDAGGAYRDYAETHTGLQAAPIEGDGWRAHAGASWIHVPWRASAAYRLHSGSGAYRSSVDASANRDLGRRAAVGLFASATQQFAEFRFGDGRTQGGGLDLQFDAMDVRVRGAVAWYRHEFDGRPGFSDYGQWRASLGVTYRFAAGADADMRRPLRVGLEGAGAPAPVMTGRAP